ncbi:MAG: hypothetical protein AAGJ40_20410 [Planctomycetota bacterium]
MSGYKFEARHHGDHDRLGLAAMLEAYANDQWVAEHLSAEETARVILDRFGRLVAQEMQLIELTAKQATAGDEQRGSA